MKRKDNYKETVNSPITNGDYWENVSTSQADSLTPSPCVRRANIKSHFIIWVNYLYTKYKTPYSTRTILGTKDVGFTHKENIGPTDSSGCGLWRDSWGLRSNWWTWVTRNHPSTEIQWLHGHHDLKNNISNVFPSFKSGVCYHNLRRKSRN